MTAVGSHIARTSIVYYVSLAILALRGLILIPLLLRLLGTLGYGTYILAVSGVSYGIIIIQMGLDSALYQYLTPALRTPRASVLFWTAILTAASWASVLVIAAAIFPVGPAGRLVLSCVCVAAGQVLWGLSLAPYRCDERSGIYTGTAISINFGDFLITLSVAALSHSLAIVLGSLAFYHLTAAIVLLTTQARKLPPQLWSRVEFDRMIRFGANGLLNQLVVAGYFVWDRIFISLTAGVAMVAAYAPGMALAACILPLAGTSAFTLPTLLVRDAVRRSPRLTRTIMRHAIQQYVLMAIPAVAGITLIARPFLNAITSPSLAAIGTPVAWLAAGAVLANGLARFAILALRARGEDRWLLRSLLLNFATFVALSAIPSSLWPAYAPVATASAILAVNSSQLFFAYRHLGNHVPNVLTPSLFLTPAIATLGFVCLRFVVTLTSLVDVIEYVVAAIAIYVAVGMAIERVSILSLWRMLRSPAELPETELRPGSTKLEERPSILLHSGPNHLFCSIGILYAAELAETFKVHVILSEYRNSNITSAMIGALRRRNIDIHWIPDRRWLSKHEANYDLVSQLLETSRPLAVFLNDDTGEFNIAMARAARKSGARVICFQTGAFGEAPALDYEYAVNTHGALWARERGLPMLAGRTLIAARLLAWHYWHYYLAPLLIGHRPYRGPSSLYLRRGHIGQRDGEAYLCYEPGGPRIAIKAGTPSESVVPIGHPLLRSAGKTMLAEISSCPEGVGARAALLLVNLPGDPSATLTGQEGKSDTVAMVVDATVGLAAALSKNYDQVLVKPHPGLVRIGNILDQLKSALKKCPQVTILDPKLDAVWLLPFVRIVVGDTSSVLKFARYFPGLIIVSTCFSDRPLKTFHASDAGLHVFATWRDVVASNLAALAPADGVGILPEGATLEPIVEVLTRRGLLSRRLT